MVTHKSRPTIRICGLAVCLLIAFGSSVGCALWDTERWNFDRYRDDRAVDIEHRLDRTEPIVQNPF